MTTIVANLEGIAADTRVSGGITLYPARKLFRIGDSILGTAGDGFMCLAFVEWFKNPKRTPKELHDLIGKDADSRSGIQVIELNREGIFVWNGWGYGEKVLREYHAIGTGGQAALQALKMGAGLEDSVTAAMSHDEYTGEEVQVEYLLPPELSPKRKRRGA